MRKIRNENGKWINSKIFREEALKFQKNKTYTAAPYGTPDWMEYWETQLDRCIKGYSVFEEDGTEHKITGHHYFYLNFTQIQIVLEKYSSTIYTRREKRMECFTETIKDSKKRTKE